MDRGIAVVTGGKAYAYLHDFNTNKWNNMSTSNGYCTIKVLQRGRDRFIVQVFEEGKFENSSEFTLSRKCEVTKTENILQIPVTNPQPCLIGLKFHNKDDEMQFLLKVGEQIQGFKLPLQNSHIQGRPPPAAQSKPNDFSRPPPNPGYMPPTMAPNIQHAATTIHSPDRLPPSASRHPSTGDIIHTQPAADSRMEFVKQQPKPMDYRQDSYHHEREGAVGRDRREMGGYPVHDQTGVNDGRNYGGSHHQPQQVPGHSGGNYGFGGPQGNRYPDPRGEPRQHGGGPGHFNQPSGYYPEGSDRGSLRQYQDDRMYQPQQRTPPNARRERGGVEGGYNQPFSGGPPPSLSSRSGTSLSQEDFQLDVNRYTRQLANTLSSCNKDQAFQLVELLTSLVAEQREESRSSVGVFSLKFEAEKEISQDNMKQFVYVKRDRLLAIKG